MSAFLKSYFPIAKGVSLAKALALEIAERSSAAAGLGKLWADTFKTNAGIYAAGSDGYTYRGTPNFDVLRNGYVNFLTGGTPSSNGVYAIAGWDETKAVDGLTASTDIAFYPYDVGLNTFFKYQLTSAKTVKQIKILPLSGPLSGGNYAIKDWVLWGSNDDANWTQLKTGQHPNNDGWQTEAVTNTTAYLFYKFTSTNWHTGTAASFGLLEIELLEDVPTASIVSVRALDLAADVTQIMLFADVTLGTGTAAYYVSTDDGTTWTAVVPETLANVPAGKQIRIKIELTGDAELEFWGVAA